MKIHKEGYVIILTTLLILAITVTLCAWQLPTLPSVIVSIVAVMILLFTTSFFRSPKRVLLSDPTAVFSPADGKVVVIEEVEESEYFNDKRLLVSVFMSVTNVHINWFPVAGVVSYFRYHPGKFLVAWHPKSSEENERTTTVVKMEDGTEVLFRQIAGLVARRIVSYAKQVGSPAPQNNQFGFIKFGSRIDLYLPLDSEVQVKLGERVVGSQTILAKLHQKA